MIRGLAIETSGRLGSVALAIDGVVIAADSFKHGLKHAAEMIPRIDALARSQDWKAGDIDEIYVSAGPGSFTGLRIGVTLAKTLAFATGAKAVAVPSVCVLAENAPSDATNVVIVLDAKRGQIFTARLHRADAQSHWEMVEAPRLDSLSQMLARAPRPVHLIGEGIPFHRAQIPSDDAAIHVTAEQTWRADASAVARIGCRMGREGQWTDPQMLLPIYIRMPEAQEKLEAAEATKRSGSVE